MGQHYLFSKLKETSTKQYGMHQSELIAQVKSQGIYQHEVEAAIEPGVCATLVTYWLAECLIAGEKYFAPQDWTADLPKQPKKDVLHARHVITATMLAPKHADYVKIRRAGDQRPGLLILCPADLEAKTQSRWEISFEDLGMFHFRRNRGYYITLVCEKARHAIGVIGRHPEGFRFFDPNAGEYRVTSLQWDRFLTTYKEIIDKKLGWGKIVSVRVSRARVKQT